MSGAEWDYSPGYSGEPDDWDWGCQVCGQHVDDCTCPICPVCGIQGDPDCYENHGLKKPDDLEGD